MKDEFVWTDKLVMEFANERFWNFRSIEVFKEKKIKEIKEKEKTKNNESPKKWFQIKRF